MLLLLLTLVAEGSKMEPVPNVHNSGTSMLTVSALLSPIYAEPLMEQTDTV